MTDEYAFWLVWRDGGNPPTFVHSSIQSATAEAERLARLNPGVRFVVLQSMLYRMVDGMLRGNFDEIPF